MCVCVCVCVVCVVCVCVCVCEMGGINYMYLNTTKTVVPLYYHFSDLVILEVGCFCRTSSLLPIHMHTCMHVHTHTLSLSLFLPLSKKFHSLTY